MNLCRIELMKIRLSVWLRTIFGIFASLLVLGILFLFLGNAPEEEALFKSWNGLFALCTAMTFACYSIFAGVIAARVIVEEYCGKNAAVLFTCPVSRKRILAVKCRIVLYFTAVSAGVSNLAVIGIMYVTAEIFQPFYIR